MVYASVCVSGIWVPLALRYPETLRCFRRFPCAEGGSGNCVSVSEPDWQDFLREGMPDCAHTEYSVLAASISDALTAYDRAVIHAAALRCRDRAWLIAAPSGTGKSTQLRCLQELCPGAFSVICGDRPILQFRHSERSAAEPKIPSPPVLCHSERSEESVLSAPRHSERSEESVLSASRHSERSAAEPRNPSPFASGPAPRPFPNPQAEILVHPSPWNGKEDWHGADAAPLAGIICLERGEQNEIRRLSAAEAVVFLFQQWIQTGWREEVIQRFAAMETVLLNTVPCWRLCSHTVPDSTRLLYQTVFAGKGVGEE